MSDHARRKTPASARGESMVWLTGLSLVLAIVMVGLLLGVIGVQGMRTFWPRPIERVTLTTGEVVMGQPYETTTYEPSAADTPPEGLLTAETTGEDGLPLRTLYRVGNRDLGTASFRWVPAWQVETVERPPEAVMVERRTWGVWMGTFEGFEIEGGAIEPASIAEFRRRHAEAIEILEESEALTEGGLGSLNRDIEATRLSIRSAELRASNGDATRGLGIVPWLGAIASAAVGIGLFARAPLGRLRGWLRVTGAVLTLGFGMGAILEHPWSGDAPTAVELAQIQADAAAEIDGFRAEAQELEQRIAELRAEARSERAVFLDGSGARRAPDRDGDPSRALPVAQVVRVVTPNDLGFGGKLQVFLSRWAEFLADKPRESNTEGGVMPVIFGTITLTLLLTIAVVPLGVIAAIYLREYAKQGTLTSLVRIAVNNLAGVPSIVYGVFGLGFFCYGVGGFIDAGPADPMARGGGWWGLLALAAILASAAAGVGLLLGDGPDKSKMRRITAGVLWAAAALLAVYLVIRTPYFGGFFPERLPTPTYGGRGLLWASLTLALLTLPVVIVATEEAISAVPRSMREGSFGCGASKWQTVRRIVLPAAAPGVMTGAILAVARGAGEVAPLMIVGAVKSAPELPVSGDFPFVHPERSFMHLGFHIYDLGFQSPDSEAARPLLWTTTLLLLSIVLVLNLTAIFVRAKLRAKAGGSVV
ncbi:MAG: ABC transporter permease subunit [Planctomycetota bacterium]